VAKKRSARGRGIARGTLVSLEALAALITVGAVVVALVNHFNSEPTSALPGEGKRIVAFRQVANRLCTEHRGNVNRALAEADSRIERLSFLARAVGWDVNDLESITPPPSRSDDFLEEVGVRRRAATQVLALQQAIELHRLDRKAHAIASLEALERESIEFSRAAGIVRCMHILPPAPQLING
jgi:hypothetical protein